MAIENNFPDFSVQGYQVIEKIGHNRAGGRVTYKAFDIRTRKPVVIKHLGASWSGYDAVNREIQMLRSLNHLGIPRYLDSFETTDGFCMVQEYVNGHIAEILEKIAIRLKSRFQ